MTPLHSATRADEPQRWKIPVGPGQNLETFGFSTQHVRIDLSSLIRKTYYALQRLWKWIETKRSLHITSRRLRLSETISLGDKRSVSIVEVDGSQYLIGSSAGSVQLLAVLDKQGNGGGPLVEKRAL